MPSNLYQRLSSIKQAFEGGKPGDALVLALVLITEVMEAPDDFESMIQQKYFQTRHPELQQRHFYLARAYPMPDS